MRMRQIQSGICSHGEAPLGKGGGGYMNKGVLSKTVAKREVEKARNVERLFGWAGKAWDRGGGERRGGGGRTGCDSTEVVGGGGVEAGGDVRLEEAAVRHVEAHEAEGHQLVQQQHEEQQGQALLGAGGALRLTGKHQACGKDSLGAFMGQRKGMPGGRGGGQLCLHNPGSTASFH